jgi:hypothetical protein
MSVIKLHLYSICILLYLSYSCLSKMKEEKNEEEIL